MNDYRAYNHQFPPLIKNLIIINSLIFLAQVTIGPHIHMTEHGMLYPIVPQKLLEAIQASPGGSDYVGFRPYQLLTHMFLHSPGNFLHLLFNMFVLWSFGRHLENEWGSKKLLFFYLSCGIGAGLADLAIRSFQCHELWASIQHGGSDLDLARAIAPALGASGAIMGVLAAYAFMYPNSEMMMMFIPFPIKAKWYVLGILFLDLVGMLNFGREDNIGHIAHLGGALTGAIIVFIWQRTNRRRYY
jgi:membrane associated rhomboid family serine protease